MDKDTLRQFLLLRDADVDVSQSEVDALIAQTASHHDSNNNNNKKKNFTTNNNNNNNNNNSFPPRHSDNRCSTANKSVDDELEARLQHLKGTTIKKGTYDKMDSDGSDDHDGACY